MKRWTAKYIDSLMRDMDRVRYKLQKIGATDAGSEMPEDLRKVHDAFFALQKEIVDAINSQQKARAEFRQ
jgi:hypothetical protein